MSQRLVSFFSSSPSIGTSARTPLSARWAQMSRQEQIIEKKRLEVLEKLEAQKKFKGKSGESSKQPEIVNKFSNDGSFLDQFKKLAQSKKSEIVAGDLSSSHKDESNIEDMYEKDESQRNYLDKEENNRDRDSRERNRGRDRDRDRNRRRSSDSRSGRGRSRSPRRRDTYNRDDRQNQNRDNRIRKWEHDNDHYSGSRRRSPPSPGNDHRRRKSRFSSPDSFSPINNQSMSDGPKNRPPYMTEQHFPNPPFINQPFHPPPLGNQHFNVPPTNNNPQHFYNNYNTQGNGPNSNFMPPNMLPPHSNGPQFGPPNIMPPPVFGAGPFPQVPGSQQLNTNNVCNTQNRLPYPPKMTAPPCFIPPPGNLVGPPSLPPPVPPQTLSNISIPPPSIRMSTPAPNLLYPPSMSVPLHNIPEPKPLDTLSIPSPKPLDAMSIPPPKPLDTMKIPPPAPLDAVKIPPPGPMNLQTIPPPMPICLTQIPKPKELNLCAIPPPVAGSVLSTDFCRSGSAMEEIASQVARSGQDLENMLIAQSAQDPSLWFLRDRTSSEYKTFREMVSTFQERNRVIKSEFGNEDNSKYIPDEDKYEPEFCLQDDSGDESYPKQIYSSVKFEKADMESEYVKKERNMVSDSDEDGGKHESKEKRRRKRKSRWGDSSEPATSGLAVPGVASITSLGGVVQIAPVPPPGPVLPISGEKPQLTRVTRQDPGLLQYALKSFGTTNLSDEDWVKCEDHYKISLLYQEMLIKRRELDNLAAKGRHKYEYDSDEETEGGTWEHKLRLQEMEATSKWSVELNKAAQGKHHIGDFLPPEELKKFMDKYSAVKTGREPDLSDYKEYKLKEDNIGFKMLQKLGWSEGEGLGADGSGIVNPINKGASREMNQGLGIDRSDMIDEGDDEFDAYRKRMMLAYRFRPNPLNNPRRPYY